jgi:hypothetical protein
MDIFVRLRGLIPNLQFSALYKPMLTAAGQIGTSHPYCDLVEKKGQIAIVGADQEVRHLAASCRIRAVDQELVSDADILAYAGQTLENSAFDVGAVMEVGI